MLVLDEQLLGRDLDHLLARWYRGAVVFITDLRPDTVIKDDAIPVLLRQQAYATFVTINTTDFWQQVAIDAQFCVICLALSDAQVAIIPNVLRAAFRIPALRTKARRMGKVVRLTQTTAAYYTYRRREVKLLPLR